MMSAMQRVVILRGDASELADSVCVRFCGTQFRIVVGVDPPGRALLRFQYPSFFVWGAKRWLKEN